MTVTPRVLFVHAHPDDETITTGGTIAELVSEGAEVMVLTATRGEGGEVIPAELKRLEGDRAGLARVREQEIAEAMRALGVRMHTFLGGTTRTFEDSGMEWGPDGHARPASSMTDNALCATDITTVARHIAAVIDAFEPHAIITYAANGGYGHPDHVRVHEATTAAFDFAEWRTGRLLYVDTPTEVARRSFDPHQAGFAGTGFAPVDTIPAKPPVGQIVIDQDVSAVLPAKRAALEAHRTQVSVAGGFFALSNGVGQKIGDREYFSIGAGAPIPSEMLNAGFAPHVLTGLDIAAVEAQENTAAQPLRRSRAPRKPGIFAYLHSAVLGLLIAFLGTMQHLNVTVVNLGETPIILPWGLVLALALAAAGLWHLKSMYRSSAPMLVAAVIIAVLSFVFGQPKWLPGADMIVTGLLRSVVWLLGPMVLAAVFSFINVRGHDRTR
ncbi:GlcNAc-PI de-N-acetylase [Brevibacterium iodinum ATCC 49514]|uniref:GlcNAc-PI de-N-acetylase n=1 Tax=Brevibacterium iodinum ATCC 49514 TaxID=1255616 RepID=A0A2H1IKD9_9MICO|nr:PIG-L family deacetylase [Brevibacterium iodinum]SMX75638.1 GlcNAc-PI de-N-acetylase [Brevibacterium iodinum ATCC 49514]SUW12222.1 1D-myo-inositol 2-acetamido-2-deoxy-alpha-D-glucopyranoside deacetylase [Brevibacterium iodinum]